MTTSPTIHIRGACPHDCPDTCATWVDVRDGVAVGFRADDAHPITQGWLCAKVRPYLDRVYHPDRLQHPLRRVGPKGAGRWERIGWDEALAEIATRWQQIIDTDGPAAILPYSYSGTLGLVQNVVTAARLFNRIGASGLERSICDAAASAAIAATLGAKWAPLAQDVEHANLVIIWGHNPASTNPHFMPFLRRAQRAGTKVIVIDPRRTTTARSADLLLQPKPATDGALALGMMNIIFAEGLHDEAWLETHALGWRELRERTTEYSPERVAGITGLAEEVIVALAREYATTKPALLKFSDGVQRHGNGGQTVRALLSLAAITGNIGMLGGGIFYSTSGYVVWDSEAVGHASECPPVPRIINMNRLGAALTGEASDPPIRALYVFNGNPAASTPNSSKIIEGLQREDLFVVVHDLFMTDTADYADIVLPATSQLEQVDLHKGYGHHFLQYNHQAIEPLGEARSNWDVMRALAEALGYEDTWLRQSVEEVIDEVLFATREHNPLLTGVTLERLQSEGTIPYASIEPGWVPFGDGVFPTPSGKVELASDAMVMAGLDRLPEYLPPAEFAGRIDDDQLVLLSGAAHHYVSSSLANLAVLMRKEGEPYLEINPADAAARGVADGGPVLVSNDRGSVRLRAIVTDDVPLGVVVSPKGPWARNAADGRNVNWLTSDALADLGGQSTFHSNLVTVHPVETAEATTGRRELAAMPGD
ncbi:MAG TPA: molybdopterin oxidoreductase family protein [Thermomicrobiales bacterium]|nr:molybdopterin oxidoreductase family protein [Thermomicrobiales bacterium]